MIDALPLAGRTALVTGSGLFQHVEPARCDRDFGRGDQPALFTRMKLSGRHSAYSLAASHAVSPVICSLPVVTCGPQKVQQGLVELGRVLQESEMADARED